MSVRLREIRVQELRADIAGLTRQINGKLYNKPSFKALKKSAIGYLEAAKAELKDLLE